MIDNLYSIFQNNKSMRQLEFFCKALQSISTLTFSISIHNGVVYGEWSLQAAFLTFTQESDETKQVLIHVCGECAVSCTFTKIEDGSFKCDLTLFRSHTRTWWALLTFVDAAYRWKNHRLCRECNLEAASSLVDSRQLDVSSNVLADSLAHV